MSFQIAMLSFASIILLSLALYLWYHPTRTLLASATVLGYGSLHCSRSFSICSRYFPYFCQLDLNMNRISWCSSFSLSSVLLICCWLGSVTSSSFSITFTCSLHLPNLRPSSLHTFFIAMYWSCKSCVPEIYPGVDSFDLAGPFLCCDLFLK